MNQPTALLLRGANVDVSNRVSVKFAGILSPASESGFDNSSPVTACRCPRR